MSEGIRITSQDYVDDQERVLATMTNLGDRNDAFWHVQAFDVTTGETHDDDWCSTYQEATELMVFFGAREAERIV